MNKEELNKKLKYLNDKIVLLEQEKEKYTTSPILLISDEYAKIQNEITSLQYELIVLNKSLLICDLKPCATSDKIDLYEEKVSGQYVNYLVTLHDTKKVIGEVKYEEDFYGNVSYFINEENRNNGYGYDALLLAIEKFKELNIEEISLHIFNDNEISLKMANKLCQIYSCEQNEYFDIKWFKFNIKEKIYKKNKISV